MFLEIAPGWLAQITVAAEERDAISRRIAETLGTTAQPDCYWPMLRARYPGIPPGQGTSKEDTDFSRRVYPIYRGTADALEALAGTEAGFFGSIAMIPAASPSAVATQPGTTAVASPTRRRAFPHRLGSRMPHGDVTHHHFSLRVLASRSHCSQGQDQPTRTRGGRP